MTGSGSGGRRPVGRDRRARWGPRATGEKRWRVSAGEDRGGATVLLLAVGVAFVVFGVAGMAVGVARVARQQAGVAADLGALAGAADAVRGVTTACESARAIVTANGGRLVDCRLDGLDLLVTVEVTATVLPGLVRAATGRARAGPPRG